MPKSIKDGKNLYIEFDGLAISGDFRDFDSGITEVNVDSTAGDDALTTTHKIRETVAPTMTLLITDDAGGDAIFEKLEHGATGNLIWGPDGNSAGEVKWGIEARIEVTESFSHGAERMLDITFHNEGRDWLFDGRSATF